MRVLGTGAGLPERILTNAELAQMVDTSDEWIVSRTGISTRHIAEGETLLSLATQASRQALLAAGAAPEEIRAVIVATLSSSPHCPSVACCLQRDLGLDTNIIAFDLNAACTGFLYAFISASGILRPGEKALLVGAEILSRFIDFSDRSTCVLFGDGAGAAVVERQGAELVWSSMAAGDEEALYVDWRIQMDGQKVFRFAVETLVAQTRAVCSKAQVAPEEADVFICHQANLRILKSAAKQLGVPLERFVTNVGRYGNTSAASVPLALHDAVSQGMLEAGAKVVLAGFGGGLTGGAVYLEWS